MPVEFDLLTIDAGTITAPAGCGKTHLIADALRRNIDNKPILVLTHSNAAVAALRGRLDRAGASPQNYRLSTIDGWAMRLIALFPTRSGHGPELLEISDPRSDYITIRSAAAALLAAGHVNDIIRASYSRLIVDEYQDCTRRQHLLISTASTMLPTCVLGDPMQAIFGFGADTLPPWEDVTKRFPVVGTLSTPHRWINAGAEELGYWLLNARERLVNHQSIDLSRAPPSIRWVPLNGTEDHKYRLRAANTRAITAQGCVLIIGDSTRPEGQQQIASQTPEAVTIESVDLRDLVSFAKALVLTAPEALSKLVYFAQTVMTNVGAADLLRRVKSLVQQTARKAPNEVELTALTFVHTPSHLAAVDLLVAISAEAGVRPHRPLILRACIKALKSCGDEPDAFLNAAIKMREENRLLGRPLPRRAVGSTLLLKGLEAEVVVILNADDMDARNLYVAMTRGSSLMVICSRKAIIPK